MHSAKSQQWGSANVPSHRRRRRPPGSAPTQLYSTLAGSPYSALPIQLNLPTQLNLLSYNPTRQRHGRLLTIASFATALARHNRGGSAVEGAPPVFISSPSAGPRGLIQATTRGECTRSETAGPQGDE